MGVEEDYLKLLEYILDKGTVEVDRTGVGTYAVTCPQLRHDLRDGFPLFTTRRVPFKQIGVQLQGFIHGKTDKQWYADRGCHFWTEWGRNDLYPAPAADATLEEKEAALKAKEEARDLGPIYGFNWNHFGEGVNYESFDTDYTGQGVNQLDIILDRLQKNPRDRRLLLTYYDPNPISLQKTALPPCPILIQLNVQGGRLHAYCYQRSTDSAIGLANDFPELGLFLSLIAEKTGYEAGEIVHTLGDCHIYLDHEEGVRELLSREPRDLPDLVTEEFKDMRSWDHTMSKVVGYNPRVPNIKFSRAV